MVFLGSTLLGQHLIAGFNQDGLKCGKTISPASVPSPVFPTVFLRDSSGDLGFN